MEIPSHTDEQLAKMLDEWNVPQISRVRIQALYEAHFENTPTQIAPAVFETVAAYLVAALSKQVPEDQGYVVAVGSWLAEFDAGDLNELGQRIRAKRALPAEEWEWVRSLLPCLV